jgi:transketolase
MAIAYPKLNVKIVGFMPGLSSPGGPSHQAIDDVALMRALPGMTVVEPADALEVTQAVDLIADHFGPVYMRLKRGETPIIFEANHRLDLARAQILHGGGGGDALIIAAGMMIPTALAAGRALEENGVIATVVNAPVVKPLDTRTIVAEASRSRIVVTAENHTVIGGVGSAVAEALAEAGVPSQLRRIGVRDVFAESGSREYLFGRYGLGTQDILDAVWSGLAINLPPPRAPSFEAASGAYAPV